MPDLKVGQTLYRIDNYITRETEIKPVQITKIGRKYFYCGGKEGYDIQTLRYENQMYSQLNIQLYLSIEAIKLREEKMKLSQKLLKFFSWSGSIKELTFDQLKQIDKIITP